MHTKKYEARRHSQRAGWKLSKDLCTKPDPVGQDQFKQRKGKRAKSLLGNTRRRMTFWNPADYLHDFLPRKKGYIALQPQQPALQSSAHWYAYFQPQAQLQLLNTVTTHKEWDWDTCKVLCCFKKKNKISIKDNCIWFHFEALEKQVVCFCW